MIFTLRIIRNRKISTQSLTHKGLGWKTQDNLAEDKCKSGDLLREGLMREWATGEMGMRTR